jgi:hypothetical protein
MIDKNYRLNVGRAGEFLVAADLILKGFRAFPTSEGLSYDIILETKNHIFLKIQVKSTIGKRKRSKQNGQKGESPFRYIFHGKRSGKHGKNCYTDKEVDIFAFIALDSKEIGYIPIDFIQDQMPFLPEGSKVSRSVDDIKIKIFELKSKGLTLTEISKRLGKHISWVCRVSQGKENNSIKERHLSDFPIDKAVEYILSKKEHK